MNISGNSIELTNKEVKVLRALIDKATPKRAKLISFKGEAVECPTCSTVINAKDKYCSVCGQKIDEETIAL